MTTFSQETFDQVVDCLHGDKAALAACSLVCKAWVPSSRYHLFSEVLLLLGNHDDDGHHDAARFLQLLATPDSIAPFIRKVNVIQACNDSEANVEEMDRLYEALTILCDTTPGYTSIFLRNMPLQFEKLTEVLPLGRLKEVTVKRCGIDDVYGLLSLFAAMPNLDRLKLDTSGGHSFKPLHVSEKLLLPQLHSFEVLLCNIELILEPLATPPTLREVDFEVRQGAEALCVGSFLRPLRSNLEKVRLRCDVHVLDDWFMQNIGLRDMTGIRSLHLDVSFRTWEYIPSIMDSINSCLIDHITFAFDSPLDQRCLSHDHWVNVPAIMERPNFGRLRKLEFNLREGDDTIVGVKRWIIRQLPGLELQGILHIH